MKSSLVALLTDFGHHDPYVGVMKARILESCPAARLVDLTHLIPPQDVRRASFHLEQSVPYFPRHTVFLAVVDPGVGSSRRALVVETEVATFVIPDNGILTRCLPLCGEPVRIVELPQPASASHTFHGRDIFAPAAGRLAAGTPALELGSPVDGLVELDFPPARSDADSLEVSVLSIDHFGNVVLDLPNRSGWEALEEGARIVFRDQTLPFARTYSEVSPGESLLLWNSENYLELACRQGRADQTWSLSQGERLHFERISNRQG